MMVFPNAKINLGLNILKKRKDGYHDIETIFYPVAIQDALTIESADELLLEVEGSEIPGNPIDNICLKAFRLLQADYNLDPVKIILKKNIPIGAGLGGGSADGAFALQALSLYFNLNISDDKLETYASQLGSDCAFFIRNKPIYAQGRGDVFSDVSVDLSNYYKVLVMPPVFVSTAEAYANVVPKYPTKSLKEIIQQPIETWKSELVNDFEHSVFQKYPLIQNIKNELYNAGALYASMSGSGASVFGIFDTEPDLSYLSTENVIFHGV